MKCHENTDTVSSEKDFFFVFFLMKTGTTTTLVPDPHIAHDTPTWSAKVGSAAFNQVDISKVPMCLGTISQLLGALGIATSNKKLLGITLCPAS